MGFWRGSDCAGATHNDTSSSGTGPTRAPTPRPKQSDGGSSKFNFSADISIMRSHPSAAGSTRTRPPVALPLSPWPWLTVNQSPERSAIRARSESRSDDTRFCVLASAWKRGVAVFSDHNLMSALIISAMAAARLALFMS